jgi:hypothetical protein
MSEDKRERVPRGNTASRKADVCVTDAASGHLYDDLVVRRIQ